MTRHSLKRSAAFTVGVALLFAPYVVTTYPAHADDSTASSTSTGTDSGSVVSSPTPSDTTTSTSTASSTDTTTPTTNDNSIASSTRSVPNDSQASSTPETMATSTPDMPSLSTSSGTNLSTSSTSDLDASGTTTPALNLSLGDATSTDATSTDPSNTSSTTPTIASSTNPTIMSGEAVVVANILNLLNTNFINSAGSIQFGNYIDPTGTLDLRTDTSTSCGSGPCMLGGNLTLNLNSDASIANYLILQASSGGNTVQSNSDGTIQTGTADAGLNLINLANTTFVNSNYLLVTLNAFSDVNGDLIFPSLAHFFTDTSTSNGMSSGSLAQVGNNASVSADSGNNSTTAASSTIKTGTASSATNIFNEINSSLPTSNVSILLRVGGNWTGQVFGAPSNLSSTQTPQGLYFYSSGSSTPANGVPGTTVLGNASSTAVISNNVQVGASSGSNSVDAANTALITTGTAQAAANIVNIANSNIVGKNWILAIINIFGNFNGNIDFGRPDLWVGDQVEAPAQVNNGSQLTYKMTVLNNGDTDASNVKLTDTRDGDHLHVLRASLPYTADTSGNTVTWNLGTIPAGKAIEVTYTVQVQNTNPGTDMKNTTKVTEYEPDNNLSDNTDHTDVTTYLLHYGGGGLAIVSNTPIGSGNPAIPNTTNTTVPAIRITRTTATSTVSNGTHTAHEALVIVNTSNTVLKNVMLDDIIYNPDGTVLDEEPWNIGDLQPKDEVDIAYDAQFSSRAPAGTYTLASKITGTGMAAESFTNNGVIMVQSMAAPIPEVLGVSTSIPNFTDATAADPSTSPSGAIPASVLTSTSTPNKLLAAAAASGTNSKDVALLTLFSALFFGSLYAVKFGVAKVWEHFIG